MTLKLVGGNAAEKAFPDVAVIVVIILAVKNAAFLDTATQSRQFVVDAFLGAADSFCQLTGEQGKDGGEEGRQDVSTHFFVLRFKEQRKHIDENWVVDPFA